MSLSCDLANFSHMHWEASEMSLQKGPVFPGRIYWGSGACDQMEMLHTLWCIWWLLPRTGEMDGWQKPNTSQSYAWLRRQALNSSLQDRLNPLLRCDRHCYREQLLSLQ